MSKFKRFLCAALAALILFYSPGFAPKAEAVAVVDDAAIITAGLLMVTLGGITFAQSNYAVSSVQNFLATNAPALNAATKLAACIVSDTGKLLITRDFESAFSDFLPALSEVYLCMNGTNEGSVCGSAPIGVPISTPIYDTKPSISDVSSPRLPGPKISFTFDIKDSSGATKQYRLDNTSRYCFWTVTDLSNNREVYEDRIDWYSLDVLWAAPYILNNTLHCVAAWHYTSGTDQKTIYTRDYSLYTFSDVASADVTYSSADGINFSKSDTIDGSQVQNTLTSADLPDSAYGDDRDKYLDIGAVSGVVAGGLAGSVLAPGLDPGSINDDLAHVLGGSISVPTPTTPDVTEPSVEATTPDDVAVAVTPEFLGGHFDGLKDLLNALLSHWLSFFVTCKTFFDSILDSLPGLFDAVVQRIDWAIHYLTAWLTDFWAAVVQAVTVSIPDFLNSIYEALETFFGVTVPAWITDVKAWALSLPRTITDAIAVALAAAFIPAAGYWDAKLAACMAAFPFFDSIITTGRSLGSFFSGLGSKPPIIYIDLQNSNSFVLGGRQIFMDLSWYSQYKPTVDTILSAFLWLIVLWRLFLALPGILRGAVGLAGNMERVSEHFHHEED